jgi:peptidyl-prolyl cis-trans isomerase B (cyclophilin B)
VRHRTLLALTALALLVAGCGGGGKDSKKSKGKAAKTATTAKTKTAAAPPAAPECKKVPAPTAKGPQHLPKPTTKLDPAKTWVATLDTSCGSFKITLDVKGAPKTSASFAYLVQRGFYDGLTFHRIVPGFVIQGGDPVGNGSGGPGYTVVEPPPSSVQYTKGVVAMAKTEIEDPGTSGSQFYVVTGADAQLPPDYAVLGKVTKGQDTVAEIGAVPVGPGDVPVQPVVIDSIRIVER